MNHAEELFRSIPMVVDGRRRCGKACTELEFAGITSGPYSPLRRQHMKAKSIVVSLFTCFFALTWCFAQDAMIGTWKLDEAKSKIGAGSPKNNTVVIEAAGENVKVTMDGVDPKGKPTHSEWTGKFDGKEYP